jgi:two-component system sensor histidine kinase ResE
VVSNLVDNACRHTDPEKAITVEVFSSGSTALVCVMDQGDGIAPEHLEHLFERFYRIDTSRESSTGGTGLGLAICKGIVEAHGGRISVESSLGKGTVFQIEIPVAEPQSASTFGSGEAPSRRTA